MLIDWFETRWLDDVNQSLRVVSHTDVLSHSGPLSVSRRRKIAEFRLGKFALFVVGVVSEQKTRPMPH